MATPLPPRSRGRELTPEEEELIAASERAFLAQSGPTPVDDPGDPEGGPYIRPEISEVETPPVVVETGGSPQATGRQQAPPGVTAPEGRQPLSHEVQVDTSQSEEARLAAQQEAPIAQAHEDTRLQQEASELYEQDRAQQSEDVQQLAEGIEERAPSGWDQAVEGLFGEGGEAHQALRSLEDATNGLITVPGAPGAGFGTDEYWNQVGWNALIAASMEATIPLVIAGVPMAVRKGAYVLRTPKATRQAASELRTAANEAHSATLQYQALRHPEVAGLRPQTVFGRPKGPVPTENLLQTTYRGTPVVATPQATTSRVAHTQAASTKAATRTGGGPMSAETSAAYQRMVTSQHRLAQAVDKVDGMPAGWTLGNNRWMGLADDLMLHRGGNPVYYANPRLPHRLEKKWDIKPREVLQSSPGRYGTTLENMPRPGTAMSSSQAASRLAPARQRMLDARAEHARLVRMHQVQPRTAHYKITDDFLQQSENQLQRATKEYDDLIQASGRLSEGREAAEGLRLLQTTLGKK